MHVGHSYKTTHSIEDLKVLQLCNEQMKRKTLVPIQSEILNQVSANTAISVLLMVNRAFGGLDRDDFFVI